MPGAECTYLVTGEVMEKGESFKRKNRPTMLQIQYLAELERLGKKRGSVAMIADVCGVNHASVSRYLKACCENGFLTEEYEFTDRGKAWLGGYKKLIIDLRSYLRNIGVQNKDIDSNVRDMIENVDYYTLTSMIRNNQKMRSIYPLERKQTTARNFLDEVLGYGTWQVYFMIFQLENREGVSVSMANRGFEKPALLRHNRRVSWLELSICEMTAHSRIDSKEMKGHLESLKYEQNGILHQAEIRDGKLRIPLGACRFHRRTGGETKGMVPITVTCSVGRTHMPESSALLVFWL